MDTSVEIAIGQPCEILSEESRPLTLTGRAPANADVMRAATEGGFDPASGLITTHYAPTMDEDKQIQITVRVRAGDLDFSEEADCTIKAPIAMAATATVGPLEVMEVLTTTSEPTKSAPEATYTPRPTYTALPTYTPLATETAVPTAEAQAPAAPERAPAPAVAITIKSFPGDQTLQNPFIFEWSGPTEVLYRVNMRHMDQGLCIRVDG